MENFKLKMTIIDENDKEVISSIMTSKLIEDMEVLHNINMLSEQLKTMLNEIKDKK